MNSSRVLWILLFFLLFSFSCRHQSSQDNNNHASHATANHEMKVPLQQPGNATFGAIQEVVQQLRADSSTDWSTVNLEALRRHLVDMHEFTVHVNVINQQPIDEGIQFTVEPTTDRAFDALKRVFKAHPPMLKQEKNWNMDVEQNGRQFTAIVTTPRSNEVPQLRALGYIGVLATGAHHQRHHWMIATGQGPHQ